jgi:hypothetical protein
VTAPTIAARAAVVTDEVRAEARRVDLGRALLVLLALFPFLVGWLAGALVTALSWAWAAVVVGYRSARGVKQEEPHGAS